MKKLTPMMKQYLELKEAYQGSILFFRLGDFYEMFYEDATLVSKELNLTLTTRDRNKPPEERTPMCGIPYHSSESYIARLITRGYKVAICEQTQDPAQAKGLVERDVVRVVTSGTVMEASMLEEGKNNYLAAIYSPTAQEMLDQGGELSLALCDISTGSLYLRNIPYSNECVTQMCNELARFAPREVLLSPGALEQNWLVNFLRDGLKTSFQEGTGFSQEGGARLCQAQFPPDQQPSLAGDRACLGGLLSYLQETQKMELPHLTTITPLSSGTFLELDLSARRNLELTESLWNREKKGTLLWVLDKTKTPMGGRLLRDWLQRPLRDLPQIQARQDGVAELREEFLQQEQIRLVLKAVPDLERLISRITAGHANGRDLRGLGQGLGEVFSLKQELLALKSLKIQEIRENLEDLSGLSQLLLTALVESPPLTIREGDMIQEGYHQEVDRLRHVLKHGDEMVAELEGNTKRNTGIRNLRVRYNRVFGYYIEVAKAQSEAVPPEWVRKQTTVNSERYISQELKELEHTILTAKEQLAALEYEIFNRLRLEVCQHTETVQKTGRMVAELDVLASFALVASQQGYCAPVLEHSSVLQIQDGRHPVVEKMVEQGQFVPNDTNFDGKEELCAIITGPNMAGKSTYMRQVALIVLMAQMGSFVPATSAKIGLVDQIFTRIGASDDLAGGRSTFMVEMSEVAGLLSQATPQSLLILDEIGRGTSTFDGMAVAKAVLEHCRLAIGAKTLFATHYHQLSQVEEVLAGVKNYNIAARQKGDDILFLRKIIPGGTDQSFGIQVAKLAGVPGPVIQRAHQILEELESGQGDSTPRPRPALPPLPTPEEQQEKAVVTQLKEAEIEAMTPLEALNYLQLLQEKLQSVY